MGVDRDIDADDERVVVAAVGMGGMENFFPNCVEMVRGLVESPDPVDLDAEEEEEAAILFG
jgi:hypothetical protein